MIFYYTATGNSLFVARHIEKNPISIPQELKKENLNYEDEIIGIVAPISVSYTHLIIKIALVK